EVPLARLPEVEDEDADFDRAVEDGQSTGRAQAEVLAEAFAAGEDDRFPAAVALFEQIAEAAPVSDGGVGEALAPGRVDRQQAGTGGWLEGEGVAGGEAGVAVQPRRLEIARRRSDDRWLAIDAQELDAGAGRRDRFGA